jgi:hypothetical protein
MICEESPPEKEIGHGHKGLPKSLVKPWAPGARIICANYFVLRM